MDPIEAKEDKIVLIDTLANVKRTEVLKAFSYSLYLYFKSVTESSLILLI